MAASLLLLGACGDGDDGEVGPSPSDLVGKWTTPDSAVTWAVSDDLIIASLPGAEIETAYTATDTTLEMGEELGSECQSGQIGVYEWEIEDAVLTITLVSDDCSGRGSAVGGISFQRTE